MVRGTRRHGQLTYLTMYSTDRELSGHRFGRVKRNWRYPKKTRLATDGRSFTVEDKFDTWLDLTNLLHIKEACISTESEGIISRDEVGDCLSNDSYCELASSEVFTSMISSGVVTPILPALILERAITAPKLPHRRDVSNINARMLVIRKACSQVLECQLNHLGENISTTLKHIVSGLDQPWNYKISQWPSEINYAYYNMNWWNEVMTKYRKIHEYHKDRNPMSRASNRQRRGLLIHERQNKTEKVILSHDLLLYMIDNRCFLMDINLLREVYNKSCELFVYLLYSHLQAGVNLPSNHYGISLEWIKHLLRKVILLSNYRHPNATMYRHNKGFGYLKMMEGLGVSELIRRSDTKKGWDNDDLCKTLWQSIYDDQLDTCSNWESSELWRLFCMMTSAQIADLIGVIKIVGHPTIEVQQGLDKLYDRTHATLNVDNAAVIESVACLTRELFHNYYRRHRRYPNYSLHDSQCCSALRTMLNHQLDPSSVEGSNTWSTIPKLSWSHLVIEKTQEFDPIDNQLPLLKDKAMGVVRSKVFQQLIGSARKPGGVIGSASERRALLKYLLTSSFTYDFQRYLDSYQHDDPWTSCVLDYLVVKLTPKELELKAEGRMFGASPLEERNRRIVQEMNCMRLMDHYVPDQLMTPNELLMIKKLYSFRCLNRVHPNSYVLQVSFDFSKWNNNMRAASIDVPSAKLLDRWFGTNLYGKTMKMYENAVIYYSDNHTARFWEGQQGGIEGLNQATWSYIFLGGIKNALERLGVLHQITVKGDDVRAALIIPKTVIDAGGDLKTALERQRDAILGELEVLCQAMGWELKPEESFVSLSLVATSKQYQVNDTWLPASSKKIVKCMSLSDIMFPTLEDIIANAYSIAHSACSQTTIALPAYICATLCSALILDHEYSLHRLTVGELSSLLLWPQVLSGPGGLPLQTFFVRGENDILSVSMSLLRHCTNHHYPDLSPLILQLLHLQIDRPEDKSLLISDPYALPVVAPPRPSTVLKNILRNALPNWVKNPDLLQLLSVQANNDKRDLVDTLLSCRPYYGKLITMIWECTPFYLIEEILSKFMQSSTVVAFLSKGRTSQFSSRLAHRTLNKVIEAAENRLFFWINGIRGPPGVSDFIMTIPIQDWSNIMICTTEIVHRVRENVWGFQIHGVTYPSLSEQNYLAQLSDIDQTMNATLVRDGLTRIHINKEALVFQTEDNSHHYAGNDKNIPWLGSQTSTKIKYLDGPIEVKSSTLTKISKLITLLRLGDYYGDSFKRVVRGVLEGLTSVNCDLLTALSPEVPFGHIGHRGAMNSFSLTTMPNYRPNLSQLVDINNESLMILRKDTYNRSINFAARNFFLVVMSLLPLQFRLLLPDDWPSHLISFFHHDVRNVDGSYRLCPFCCNIIDDVAVTVNLSTKPSLSHYHTLPIVGTSQFEENELKKLVATSIMGKAKRHLYQAGHNPDDPVNQRKAVSIILQSLFKESINVFHEAQRANFSYIPRGALLDTMAVSMGFKSLASSTLSLNVIRAMDPQVLYEELVVECYKFTTQLFADNKGPVDLTSLELLQSHLNPLSSLFQVLNNAGVLHKISYGCSVSQLINKKLHWPPGSSRDGHTSSKHFLMFHLRLFRNWLDGEDQPHRQIPFQKMQNDELIERELDRHYVRLGKVMLHQITRWISTYNIINVVKKWGQKIGDKICEEHDGSSPISRDDFDTALEDHITTAILHESLNHSNTWLARFAMVMLIFEFPYTVERGVWYDGDIDYIIKSQLTVTIMAMREADPPSDDDVPWDRINASTWLSWAFSRLEDQDVYVLWTIYNFIIKSNRFTTLALGIMDKCLTEIWSKVQWMNKVNISIMTEEDAERMLRQSGHTLDSYIDTVDYAPATSSSRDSRPSALVDTCNLHTTQKYSAAPIGTIILGGTGDMERVIQDLAGLVFYGYSDINVFRLYKTDLRQLARCMGGYNSSVCKWMFLYQHIGIANMLPTLHTRINMVAVGDGNGGVSRMFCAQHPNIHSLVCTLAHNTTTGEVMRDYDISTPLLDASCNVSDNAIIKRIDHTTCYPGDINETVIQRIIVEHLQKHSADQNFLVCDLDWSPTLDYHEYLRCIWSVLQVIRNFPDEDTFALVKLKVIQSEKNLLLLNYVYHTYPHLHILIVPYSTPHDSEIFLFIGLKDYHRIDDRMFTAMSKYEMAYRPSGDFIRCVDMVTRDFNVVQISSSVFVDAQITTMQSYLEPIVNGPFRVQTLDRLLSHIDTPIYIRDYHLCTLMREIRTAITDKLNGLLSMHNKYYRDPNARGAVNQRERIPELKLEQKKDPVAKGPTGLVSLITNIIKSKANLLMLELFDTIGPKSGTITNDVIQPIHSLIAQILTRHKNYIKLLFKDGAMIIVLGPHIININEIIANAYNKCLRVYGGIIVLSMKYHYMYKQFKDTVILGDHEFPRAQCCIEKSLEYLRFATSFLPRPSDRYVVISWNYILRPLRVWDVIPPRPRMDAIEIESYNWVVSCTEYKLEECNAFAHIQGVSSRNFHPWEDFSDNVILTSGTWETEAESFDDQEWSEWAT